MFDVRPRRAAAALVAITILAYLPTFRAGFIWDDDSYVEHNASLRTAGGLWRIWSDTNATPQYYPLVHTTFWIEQHLWGTDSAIPFHIVNVLLHATAAVLLWRLLMRLLPGWPLHRPPLAAQAATPVIRTAWLAAALWAVHPLQVESVAWVTERKNVLSGVFYLLAFGTYFTAVVDPQKPRMYIRGSVEVEPRRYAAAFCLFLLALFAKTVTATLPAAVLLVLWWKRGRLTVKDVLPTLPFFLAGALLGLNTGHLERVHVGAHGPEFAFAPIDRVLIAGRAVCFYAAKLVVPWPLSFIYPRWTIDHRQPWQYAFPAIVAAVIVTLWAMRRRLGRGPLVAALFFVGTLFPALGFANVYPMRYAFVADHFQYLACIGPLTLLATVLPLAASRIWGHGGPAGRPDTPDPRSRKRQKFLTAVIVLTCTSLTFARSTAYFDRLTLFTDTVVKNPNSWMARTNLGHELVAKNQPDAAWVQYQQAERLAPNVPDTHFNLAMGYARLGDYAAAADECRRAIAVDRRFVQAHANLAKIELRQGHVAAALDTARTATEIQPGYPGGHTALGDALEKAGRLFEARDAYQTAVDLGPDDAAAHVSLANMLNRLGQTAAAVDQYEAAVSIDGTDPAVWTNLGFVLLRVDRTPDAATSFRRALAIDPASTAAAQGLRLASGR